MLIYKPAAWKVNYWTECYRNNKYYKLEDILDILSLDVIDARKYIKRIMFTMVNSDPKHIRQTKNTSNYKLLIDILDSLEMFIRLEEASKMQHKTVRKSGTWI